jgi:hypothetical protein
MFPYSLDKDDHGFVTAANTRSTAPGANLEQGHVPSLASLASGFPLRRLHEDVWFAWGTVEANLQAREFLLLAQPDVRCFVLDQVTKGFGFELVQVETLRSSYFADRWIEQVWYSIRSKDASNVSQAKKIHAKIIEAWETPRQGQNNIEFPSDGTASEVAAHAEWRTQGVRIGDSWFGAPRKIQEAFTVGIITLHWDDQVAVAKPFLAQGPAR